MDRLPPDLRWPRVEHHDEHPPRRRHRADAGRVSRQPGPRAAGRPRPRRAAADIVGAHGVAHAGAGATARGVHFQRLARVAHAADQHPALRRDAAARSRPHGRRAARRIGNHHPRDATARADDREPAGVLARRSAGGDAGASHRTGRSYGARRAVVVRSAAAQSRRERGVDDRGERERVPRWRRRAAHPGQPARQRGALRPRGTTLRVVAINHAAGLELTVEDEGPGIAPADRHRVWQAFERGVNGNSGTGIGLAVVHQLVELHGGDARIEDAEPGARFVITLPSADPPREA